MNQIESELDDHVFICKGGKIPPNYRNLTPSEIKSRKETLLKEYVKLTKQYQSLPLTSNTLRGRALRNSLDNRMKKIENYQALLEMPTAYYNKEIICHENGGSGDAKMQTA